MPAALTILSALLAADLIILGIYVIQLIFSNEVPAWSSVITPFFIGAGVLTALLSLFSQNARKTSEDYLKNSLELLEKSFATLNVLDDNGWPKQSRLNWLTSARLLRASDNVSELITENHHKRIYQEELEFWRGRFYDLLMPDPVIGLPSKYFADDPQNMIFYTDDDREPITEDALVVLYRFIRWPKGFQDPIQNEPKFTDDEIKSMCSFGPRGLGDLIAAVREWEQIQSEKNRQN